MKIKVLLVAVLAAFTVFADEEKDITQSPTNWKYSWMKIEDEEVKQCEDFKLFGFKFSKDGNYISVSMSGWYNILTWMDINYLGELVPDSDWTYVALFYYDHRVDQWIGGVIGKHPNILVPNISMTDFYANPEKYNWPKLKNKITPQTKVKWKLCYIKKLQGRNYYSRSNYAYDFFTENWWN